MKTLFISLFVYLLSLGTMVDYASSSGLAKENGQYPMIEPKIGSAYAPAEGSDEFEIWTSLEKVEAQLQRSPLLIQDVKLQSYVSNIMCKLDAKRCNDIRIYLVRNPNFNALMYPNGMMVIWTGLMLRMENEAQLAAVMGHELGHYLRQHSLVSWRAQKKASKAGLAISLITGAVGLGVVGDLINLGILSNLFRYSRAHETEADIFGAQKLVDAGYRPDAAANLWAYVEKEEQEAVYKKRQPIFFRSHPVNKKRIELLLDLSNSMDASGQDYAARYWRNLNPMYINLVNDQFAMNKPGRSTTLLTEHEGYKINQSYVDFAWGELYRRSRTKEDTSKAIKRYEAAIKGTDVPSAVYRELGILEMKQKKYAKSKQHLKHYLKTNPKADDLEIVKFYLNSVEAKSP